MPAVEAIESESSFRLCVYVCVSALSWPNRLTGSIEGLALNLLSDEGCLQPVVRSCEGGPGWVLGLSGHVQRIWLTDFDAIFSTDYCNGLVVHAIIWKDSVAPFMVFRGCPKNCTGSNSEYLPLFRHLFLVFCIWFKSGMVCLSVHRKYNKNVLSQLAYDVTTCDITLWCGVTLWHQITNFGAKGLWNVQHGRCVNAQAFSLKILWIIVLSFTNMYVVNQNLCSF